MRGPGGVVSPLGTQISFVGATMPRDLENILGDIVPVHLLLKLLCSVICYITWKLFKLILYEGR